jgi:hypothetical protein
MDIFSVSGITHEVTKALSSNQFLQGGAVLAILVGLGNALKSVPMMVWNRIERLLIYRVNIEELDDLFYYFEVWLSDNHKKKYRNVEASIKLKKDFTSVVGMSSSDEEFLEELKLETYDKEKIYYKQFDDVFYIRRGLLWIRIEKDRQRLENAGNLSNAFYNKFLVSGFSKRVVSKLIEEVLEYNKKLNSIKKRTSIDVKSSSEYGDWVKESVLEPKPLSSIYLEGKHVILDDVHNFLDSEEWYKKNHIIYKRGYLLTGPPGNGKTSFIMSLAKELKRTINFLNLNNVGDKAIRDLFRNLKSNSILVIEDIDAAFSSRDNEKSIRFSFSTLLNCLDGVFSKENIIVIFTSNHPEKLDAALIREGRVDRKFEFKNPSVDVISSYLSDQFGEPIDFSDYIDEYSQKLPMVGVQNTVFSNRGKTVLEVANAIYEKDRDFDPDKYKLKVNDKDGSENDH